jgi:chorismate lyase / 3-hydroxybenzoate synthase
MAGGVEHMSSGDLSLLTTIVRDAGLLDTSALENGVRQAYLAIGEALCALNRSAIRLWNYLPDPNGQMAPGLDRYMVFNAGRHHGYAHWTMPTGTPLSSLPTASAVGVESRDLVVQCLASTSPGHSIENPRQRPAWTYSARYGPKPPSFARATMARVASRQRLLIAGTASIVGEDSMHVGDLAGQLGETFTNLASVIHAAAGAHDRTGDDLSRLTDVRVYVARPQDSSAIEAAVRARCPGAWRELVIARLCRPELLVEIEGIADLPLVLPMI